MGKRKDAKHKLKGKRIDVAESWVIKITVFTFVGAVVCSFVSQLTTSRSDITVSIMLLAFMLLISIIFDGIGLSVASCTPQKLLKYEKYGKPYSIALRLVQNAEKVNNICADVVGDMCGILSGACGASIVLRLCMQGQSAHWTTIIVSSVIAAITVGGKASFKKIAVKNSEELVFMSARIISVFTKNNVKKNTEGKK